MKKNFVQKLALGLALVMTVTSVPATSKAAVKPAFKTSSVTVTEGETVKAVIKNTKGWTAKKIVVKDGTVAEATAVQKKKKVNVKVTGVKAGETKVVTKLTNGKKVVKAKLNVTVTAPEVATMTAEATGVKEITVTFSKAVDAASTVTVKKAAATPTYTSKLSEDGKTLVLTMGAKLTKGTYTVAVGELTADVIVEDEKVTSIEISKELIATEPTVSSDKKNYATVGYKVLNQYGERMAGEVSVSCSLGTDYTEVQSCNAKRNGIAQFEMSAVLFCVPGTTGTVTVVETKTGVTATSEVVYSAASTAKTLEVVGVVDLEKAVLPATITAGRDAADYGLYVQVLDQYGNPVKAEAFKDVANITVADSTTGLDIKTDAIDEDPENEDYLVIPFVASKSNEDGKIKSGKIFVSIVNKNLGSLFTGNFEAIDPVLLGSFDVYAESDIYDKATNALSFEAYDKDGNAVKDYATLSKLVKFGTEANPDTTLSWDENLDGSASLYYTPVVTGIEYGNEDLKNYTYATHTMYINGVDLTQQTVKTVQFTVKEKRVPVAVTGLQSGTVTAVDNTLNETLKIAAKNIKLEDQYGNEFSKVAAAGLGDKVSFEVEGNEVTATSGTATDGITLKVVKDDATVSSTVHLWVTGVQKKSDAFEVKVYPVDTLKATDLYIASLNPELIIPTYEQCVLHDTVAATITSGSAVTLGVSVQGKVGGKLVNIPARNYSVTSASNAAIVLEKEGRVEKAATLEITVNTYEKPVVLTKAYTYSNVLSTLKYLEDASYLGYGYELAVSSFTSEELADLFYMVDQYGDKYTKGDVKFTIRITEANDNESAKVANNGTQYATVSGLESGDMMFITATLGELKAMTKVTVKAGK